MKKLLLLALALGMPSAASAQLMFYDDGFFQYMTRPYRDRAERFKSARADALQMTVAIDDEASRLTLETWADNRAGLREEGASVKAGANLISGAGHNAAGAKTAEWSGSRFGAYGRYTRLEAEGYSGSRERKTVSTGNTSETNTLGGGAGYAFGGEDLSFGLHGNLNRTGDKNWDSVDYNDSLGGAVAASTDLYDIGATADYVMRGSKDDLNDEDLPLNGPAFGAQAMLKPFAGLKAALRANFAMLSGDATDGAVSYDKYELAHKELGARLEWKLDAVPLTLGLEYTKMIRTPDELKAGVRTKTEMDNDLKTFGAGLRLLDDRLLLAAEAKEFIWRNEDILPVPDKGEVTFTTLTGGAELWILPGFAARASYQKQTIDTIAADVNSSIIAAGVGFKGEKMSLDVTARRISQDEDAVEPDGFTDVHLRFGMKF